jgi:hypothetical protein
VASGGAAWRHATSTAPKRPPDTSAGRWKPPDARRRLQLALAALWLLDAVLQFQAVMFSRSFAQMLTGAAHGNPAFIAGPITWSAHLVEQHAAAANACFATIQLLLALGIAWRPATRIALAASVVWALAVWWLGEGLGLLLTGTASPVNGAPGAVILYALLAVLLWPVRRDRPAPFAAGGAVSPRAARLIWLALWGSLGCLALQQAARAPRALGSTVSGMASGEPGWLGWADTHLGSLISHQGGAASIVLVTALLLVAAGIYLPASALRASIVLAVAVAAVIGIAQAFGGILSGAGTDPGSGPLLALLAIAYWPSTTPAAASPAALPGRPATQAGRPAALPEPAGGG